MTPQDADATCPPQIKIAPAPHSFADTLPIAAAAHESRAAALVRGTDAAQGTIVAAPLRAALPRSALESAARYYRGRARAGPDRRSVVEGKSVSVRVELGGRRIIKKKKTDENKCRLQNQKY